MGRPSKRPGGVRQGTPGTAYSSTRSDLNTPPAFKGQVQGSGVQQAAVMGASQQGAQAAQAQPGEMGGGGPLLPPGTPAPGEFPPITAPTERPGEPVTHGMPFGAGPNALPQPFTPDPLAQAKAALTSLPAVHQTPMLKALSAALGASTANASAPGLVQQ